MKLKPSQEELLNGVTLLTPAEVLGILHVSRSFLHTLRDRGILSPVVLARRIVRYHPEEVRAYLKALDGQRRVKNNRLK